ncbi:MAG TPA: hypothetical protein VFA28_00525, partial [Bryobacteraceae bacterium]|nr:hypothetical protein [Bryobacteraceae bacterium]
SIFRTPRAIDFVEVDPEKDIADQTVPAAAACIPSFVSAVMTRLPASAATDAYIAELAKACTPI